MIHCLHLAAAREGPLSCRRDSKLEGNVLIRIHSEVKVARHSVGWQPSTTFTEIRASVAAQGGLGPRHAKDHDKTTEGVEYRAEDES